MNTTKAEQTILGRMMAHQDDLDAWIGQLTLDHFTSENARQLFSAIKRCHMIHGSATIETVGGISNEEISLFAVDCMVYEGMSDLGALYQSLERERIQRKAKAEIRIEAQKDEVSPEDLAIKLMGMVENKSEYPEFTMSELSTRFVGRLESPNRKEVVYGMGIPKVDDYVRVKMGHSVYIVAPPKVGKTWLEASIASFLSIGKKVYFASAEMDPDELYVRMASHISGVDLTSLEYKELSENQYAANKFAKNVGKIAERNMTIANVRGITFPQLMSKLKAAVARGFDVIIIDYLQRIQYLGAKSEREATMAMSRQLTNLASKHNRLMIMASQAGRAARQSEFTEAHHAQESSAVEQDADVILSLTDKTDYNNPNRLRQDAYRLVVTITQRHGWGGRIQLNFNPSIGKYEYVEGGWDE